MSRRKGRVIAFQALYSYDVGGLGLDELLKLEWVGRATSGQSEAGTETYDFARILIAGTLNHLSDIDVLIKRHLSAKWDFSRLNRVSLAILRMSVFSLRYQPETHPSIVIDEAVSIAKEYGADESFKFVNALLDSIRKELAT
ncbi:MAG: transcription antitermination factor NusB [Treponema sp.]|nr:transcription antitermination factor NusB [Treponema sp.]